MAEACLPVPLFWWTAPTDLPMIKDTASAEPRSNTPVRDDAGIPTPDTVPDPAFYETPEYTASQWRSPLETTRFSDAYARGWTGNGSLVTVASLTAGQLYIEATIGIASQAFWADVLSVVTMTDLAHCFGKAFLFALLIALIGIVMGLGVAGGSAVLGRATTSSVVTCIGAIIAADTAVALLL